MTDSRPVSPEGPAPSMRELLMTIRKALPNSTTRPEIKAAWSALDELLGRSRSAGSPETAPKLWQVCPLCNGTGAVGFNPAMPSSTSGTGAGGWTCPTCNGIRIIDASAPSPGEAGAPTTPKKFHAGHAIGLHMVIELAKSVEPTGDEKADTNIRNAIQRSREVQEWLEPLAHGHPVAARSTPAAQET